MRGALSGGKRRLIRGAGLGEKLSCSVDSAAIYKTNTTAAPAQKRRLSRGLDSSSVTLPPFLRLASPHPGVDAAIHRRSLGRD